MENRKLDAFKKVIVTGEPPRLGPQHRAGALAAPDVERELRACFDAQKIPVGIQPLLRSAALLWHDHLDASHAISQGIETRDGSWLHGIMHRREPDYGNAKYWFHRVGSHQAFPALAEKAASLLEKKAGDLSRTLVAEGEWQPFVFVDLCERAERSGDFDAQRLLREIQAIEFDVLVSHILGSRSDAWPGQ